MSKRKKHNEDAGYIAERTNPFIPGEKVVIYIAAKQGLDDAGGKYAIVCDAHSTNTNTTNIPDARVVMKHPEIFCEECCRIKYAQIGGAK